MPRAYTRSYKRGRVQAGVVMAVHDFRRLDDHQSLDADICIVGSGPAGWALAEELGDCGLSVLVLESGGALESGEEQIEPDAEALSATRDIGHPLFNGRRRTLGGTPEAAGWGKSLHRV